MSVFEENWDLNLDLIATEMKNIQCFKLNLNCIHENICKLLEESFTERREFLNSKTSPCQDDQLNIFIEENEQLQQNVDRKLKEIAQKESEFENYKINQKKLSHQIKEKHEAFLMAKKVYKKFLNIYYTNLSENDESQTILIQFFTDGKRDSESCSVWLKRDCKMGQYRLLKTNPKLSNEEEIKKKLIETNDVPGALDCIRGFLKHKSCKN